MRKLAGRGNSRSRGSKRSITRCAQEAFTDLRQQFPCMQVRRHRQGDKGISIEVIGLPKHLLRERPAKESGLACRRQGPSMTFLVTSGGEPEQRVAGWIEQRLEEIASDQ